jgi:SAM-dependent methyltransferase
MDPPLSAAGPAFDRLAPRYDALFSERPVGRRLRSAVWRVLDSAFQPGDRVLDLGCGTGEDAVHLAARGLWVEGLDASPAMVAEARRKAQRQGVGARARFRVGQLEALAEPGDGLVYDGALSDFGALNCVADLDAVAAGLGGRLRPGGRLVLVLMGPLCLWEIGWFLAHGAPRTALRRWRPGPATARVGGRSLAVRYPSPARLRRAFRPWFRPRRSLAVGLALPPSDAAGWVEARPRLLGALAGIEDRLAHRPGAAWLADHYLVELERRADL